MSSHSPKIAADHFFVLASGSPRRREFMELLGLPFIVATPASVGSAPIDETPLPAETPPVCQRDGIPSRRVSRCLQRDKYFSC